MEPLRLFQLKAAGAIQLARTNMPDFGMRSHTDNELYGPTINPWSATHSPGGSSGGEAAALATGMTPLGTGNDYAGSLRLPSQACGTVALLIGPRYREDLCLAAAQAIEDRLGALTPIDFSSLV